MGMFDDLLATPAPTSAPPLAAPTEQPASTAQAVASLPVTPPEIAAPPERETDADLGIGVAPKGETDEELGIKPTTSKLGALGAGAESGLTIGYSPEIHGFSAEAPLRTKQLIGARTGENKRLAALNQQLEAQGVPYEQRQEELRKARFAARQETPEQIAAYEAAKTGEEERQKQAQEAHPYIYGIGNIVGTAIPMALATPEAVTTEAIAKTAPLATRALGYASRGAQEAWRAFRGAAPLGAVAGLHEGDTWTDRLENAATQAGLWGLGGVAGSAAGAGLTGAAKYAYGKTLAPLMATAKGWFKPTETASTIVSDALKADAPNIAAGKDVGLTLEQFAAAKAAGDPVSIMDLGGENTRALLRSVGNISPEAWGQLESHLTDRFKDQTERIAGDVRKITSSGNADALKTTDELRAAYDASRRPAYVKAYSQPAAQSIWDTELEHAAQAPMVQQAIRMANLTAKNEAAKLKLPPPKNPFITDESGKFTLGTSPTGEQLTPNLQFWDVVKKNLDEMGTEGKGWSKALREHLDTIVPEYKDARGVAQKYFNGMDATEAGADAVGKKESPQLLARQFKQLPPTEQELFRESYASKMANDILNVKDRRDAAELLLNSPNDRARAEIIFGKDKLPILENRIRLEQVMQKAKAALGNSTTIKQAIALGLVGTGGGAGVGYVVGGEKGAEVGAGLGTTLAFAPAHAKGKLAGDAIIKAAQSVKGVVNTGLAKQIANILTSDDPEALNRVAAMAAKNPKVAEGLKQLNSLFSQGVSAMSAQTAGRAGAPTVVPAAAATTPTEPSRTGMFDDLLATPPPTAALQRAVGGMIEANPGADPQLVPENLAFTEHDPRPGWQQFSGINGPRYQLGPERVIRAALTLPGDVASGRVPVTDPLTGHTSDELIERSWDLANLAGGVGMPMAEAGAVGTAGGKLFHPAAKPTSGLYSATENAVAKAGQTRMQPKQWVNWLKNQPGVKQEELDWLGLSSPENLPTNPKGLAEKEDILAHIRDHDVPLHEVARDEPITPGVEPTPKNYRYDRYQLPGGTNYREIALAYPPKDGVAAFDSAQHWNAPDAVPNVVGHLRVNDRDIPDVGKSLHLEELQSDWHQKGRTKGYGTDETPDGPFKKTWPDLLLKHALNKAAKEDYDAVSWTPGKSHADRYNDDRRIDRLEYKNGVLTGTDAEGEVNFTGRVSREKVADHYGKEVADKLFSQPIKNGAHVLQGDELNVPGLGHKGFYDNMLVNKANELGKKYGTKVEWKELPGAGPGGSVLKVPTMRLTPELKEQALTKGFPKFKKGGVVKKRANGGASTSEDATTQPTPIERERGFFTSTRDLPENYQVPEETASTPKDPRSVWQQLTGQYGPRAQLWPEQMVRSALTLPGDVYSGRTQVMDPTTGHTSEEVLQRTKDLASLVGSGGLPMAKPGAVGMAGGRLRIPTVEKAFSPQELKSALAQYVGDDAYTNAIAANYHLREPGSVSGESLAAAQHLIPRIDQAFRTLGKPLDETTTFYRYAPTSTYAKPGVDKGFMHVTKSREIAEAMASQAPEPSAVYKVIVPKGTPTLETDPFLDTRFSPKEEGVLLPRGGKHTPIDTNTYEYALPSEAQKGFLQRARGGKTNHNPTEAQKHAGNYSKRQVAFQGLDISIENEKGSTRRGADKQGNPWATKLPVAYGYIKGTTGKDKDHLDVYVGPHKTSKNVFVVDQVDPETGRFDEHKIMLGFGTKNQALRVYKKAFSDGSGNTRVGKAHSLLMPQLKEWLKRGDTTVPFKVS